MNLSPDFRSQYQILTADLFILNHVSSFMPQTACVTLESLWKRAPLEWFHPVWRLTVCASISPPWRTTGPFWLRQSRERATLVSFRFRRIWRNWSGVSETATWSWAMYEYHTVSARGTLSDSRRLCSLALPESLRAAKMCVRKFKYPFEYLIWKENIQIFSLLG